MRSIDNPFFIKEGDIVALKSGGPHMTADKRYGERFRCVWFNEDGSFSVEYFRRDSLFKPKSKTNKSVK